MSSVREDISAMRQEMKDFFAEYRRTEAGRDAKLTIYGSRITALEHWRTATAATVSLLAAWAYSKFGVKF